jgi:2-methylcitrate dehydratase PrpD
VVRGPWHPGVNVLPAALALGEQFRISGAHLLRAIAVGYDIGTRVMVAAGVQMDFRTPTNSMGGVFGATAAAACAASLTAQQSRWALAYGAQQCSGIDDFRRDLEHIEKGFMNGGMGARSGVTSTLLVLAGFNGLNDIMSGPVSFFEPFASAKPELLVEKLGERYYVTEPTFKRWPVGAPVQGPLDAMQVLLKRQPIDPNQVREIIISYGQPGSITDNGGPPDINVQHAVALMLVDKKLTFNNIHDYPRMKDPAIVRLRAITKIIRRPSGSMAAATTSGSSRAVAPRTDGAAQPPVIQITLADGTRLTQDAVSTGIPGTESTPYTREWVVGKARSLMTPVLGATHAAELIDRVLKLEDTRNILELRPLLQRKPSAGPPRRSDWPMA